MATRMTFNREQKSPDGPDVVHSEKEIKSIRRQIRRILIDLLQHYTQTEVARQLELHQPQISQLYNEKPVFSDQSRYKDVLNSLQQFASSSSEQEPAEQVPAGADKELNAVLSEPSYSRWLIEQLAVQNISIQELVTAANVSMAVINRITSGETSNPQKRTKDKIEKGLNKLVDARSGEAKEPIRIHAPADEDQLFVGLPFEMGEVEQVPEDIGVYVIHDRRGFPLYIGSGNVRRRLKGHLAEADYARPMNASKFSYFLLPKQGRNGKEYEKDERKYWAAQIERVFIKMSGNALSHNKHHRTDLSVW